MLVIMIDRLSSICELCYMNNIVSYGDKCWWLFCWIM